MATSFASSSTSPSHSGVYDVFINHRGPDVKKGIASHIYHRLKDSGLAVFLDQPEMKEGEKITPQIKRAIRTASVHIAIFSPGYADSPWCLDELLDMLDSGSTILPLFYNVQPSDLRWTQGRGVYDPALCRLQKKRTFDEKPRYDLATIEKWRKALSDVSLISGFELNACNGDEGQLVHDVVQQVLKKVRKPLLDVAKYPTGLVEKVKDLEMRVSVQRQSGKPSIVGIVGFGGVGKTTLAKEFFNCERANYDRSCFLFDVRSTSLHSLQSILLKDLNLTNVSINRVEEGKEKLKRHLASLTSQKVFMVLDDVDHIDQLDALLSPVKDAINQLDSLILVTSRNKDVLTSSGITESSIYPLKTLNRQHSQELFCSHAFGQPHSLQGFDEVVEKFLIACDGLPLSLKVLGALLRGKDDLRYWNAQLQKTSKMLPSDILTRLRISYDALDPEEKDIFLDIACFFIGEDRDTAIRIWDGSDWEGWLGLWKLENRCLVEVDSKNRLRMHDHLRDLGRELAENSEYPRRLWRLTNRLLHNVQDQSPVRGISMLHGNGSDQSFENLAGRCNLSNCNLLRAESHFVEQVFSNGQLARLIYLRWENCPKSSLHASLPSMNLRVLHIEGEQLKTLWQHESQAPLQLRELYVHAPLSKVPESIGKLKYLEKITLYNGNMTLLPDSVGNLTSLQSLHLSKCSTLQRLPDSVGNLTGLQTLNLDGCSTLQRLPDSVGNLTGLQTLYLRGCSTLQTLLDSVRKLTGLQTLYLNACSTLQTDSVRKLTGLQTLYLNACSTLQTLNLNGCSTLQTLHLRGGSTLQTFHLRGCSTLQKLPDTVGNLTGVQTLDLSGCSTLQTLPDTVGNMTGLGTLDLSGCSTLQTLPDSVGNLTGLRTLDLSGCSTLQTLPDMVGNLMGLQMLDLSGCSTLQTFPDTVWNLTDLQMLDLSGCSTLQTLPDSVGNLTGLPTLDLSGCSTLQTLPDSIGNLTGLQTLDLSGCSTLQTLPDTVGNLTGLQTLDLSGCSTLQTLPDTVGNLTGLPTLDLSGCSTLQTLPDSVGNLTGLRTLDLSGCSNLHMLTNIEHLSSLENLNVQQCPKLQWCSEVIEQLRQRLGEGFMESILQ